jgi:hypothetical protein
MLDLSGDEKPRWYCMQTPLVSLLGDRACTAAHGEYNAQSNTQIKANVGASGGICRQLLSAVKWGQIAITQKQLVQLKGPSHHIC